MTKRSTIFAALTAILVFGTPGLLLAHAHLTRSEPAANTRVSAPRAIRLWFSEAPELPMTRLTLRDSAGNVVQGGRADRGDTKLDVRMSLKNALRPGRYTLAWYVVAADGHPSSGTFAFTVAP